jgi:hypothetical protein
MQNRMSSASDDWEDDEFDEFSDVDRIFSKLESFEPPEQLVQQIMDAVSKLPPLSTLPQNTHNTPDQTWQRDQDMPS